jgi:uncharacterized protein YkwD
MRICARRTIAGLANLGHAVGVNRGVARATLVVVATGLVTIGLLASSAFATSKSSERRLPTLSQQVFAAINGFRTSHGLVALHESRALDRSALSHSLEMGAQSYFAHNSADGQAFWLRIRRYYGAGGYSYWAVGENLLWDAPRVSAAAALQQWINSPPHLRNLETAKWRSVGVSAVTVADAGGVYGGQRVTIITTDFGVRSR